MDYLFQLGHSPHLASRELTTVLQANKVKFKKTQLNLSWLHVFTKSQLEEESLVNRLGGTVRICQKIGSTETKEAIADFIFHRLKSDTKPTFVITYLPNNPEKVASLSNSVKQKLKEQGLSSRFLPYKDQSSPREIKENKVIEFIIHETTKGKDIYKTHSVSDSKAWEERDRQRPYVDVESGIMPPKVARMMINLGLKDLPSSSVLILDPFCGSGTILAEAMMMGLSVFGSDIQAKAVEQTTQNLEWLKQKYQLTNQFQVIQADATTLESQAFSVPAFDLIVAEGFLGPSLPTRDQLPLITNQLEALYAQALPHLNGLLKEKGRLVLALPKFQSPESPKMIQSLIELCEKSGYNLSTGPHIYGQPSARVKRSIIVLEKFSK